MPCQGNGSARESNGQHRPRVICSSRLTTDPRRARHSSDGGAPHPARRPCDQTARTAGTPPRSAKAHQIGARGPPRSAPIRKPRGPRRGRRHRGDPARHVAPERPRAAPRHKAAPRARNPTTGCRAAPPRPTRAPPRCRNASRPGSGSARPSSPRCPRAAGARRLAVVGNSASLMPWPSDTATCASVVSSWLASTAP